MRHLATSGLGLAGAFVLATILTHCASPLSPAGPNASDAGPSPDSSTLPTPTSTATTPPGPPPLDPWAAPAGELVPNALVEDGWYDLRFLPSPANLDGGWHDSVAVQADGRSFLFAYSAWEFADLTDFGMFNVTGPLRAGMAGPELKNFRADLTASGWSVSYLSTNSAERVNEAAPSINVAQDLQVFVRYTGSKGDIYFATRSGGGWGAPRLLPGPANGAACSNDNPFVVGSMSSGVDLYFESDRADVTCSAGGAKKRIFQTRYDPTTDTFTPVTLVPGINGRDPAIDEDTQPFVTPDKQHIYWTSVRADRYAIMTADWGADTFANPRVVVRSNVAQRPYTGKLIAIGEANIAETAEGSLMFMICGVATRETGPMLGAKLRLCRAKKDRRSRDGGQ